MINVLHITSAGGHGRVQFGGAERGVAELTAGLSSEPTMRINLAAPEEFLRAIELPPRVETFEFEPYCKPVRFLDRLVKQLRPDVVITHLLRSTLLGQPIGAFRHVPGRISILHNSLNQSLAAESRLRTIADRVAFTAVTRLITDRTVAISAQNASDLVRRDFVPPHKVVLIPDWVPDWFRPEQRVPWRRGVRTRLGIGSNRKVIGFLGRLEPQKDPLFAVRLIAELEDVELLVIGTGSQIGACSELAEQLGAAKRVRFLGYQTAVGPFMAACDAVVVPSVYEGFGRVAAEALALGVPVVANDVDGLPFILSDAPAEGARLVSPHDMPQWVSAVELVLSLRADDPLRAELSRYARERFSFPAAKAAWAELIRSVR